MTFRLASILSLREAELSESSHEVASFESQVRAIDNSRTEVELGRQATRHKVSAASKPVVAADLHLATDYLKALDREDERLRREAELVQQSLATARTVLVGRHQAVSVLQRLRDRLAEAEALELARSQQRALDEVSAVRAHRRKLA